MSRRKISTNRNRRNGPRRNCATAIDMGPEATSASRCRNTLTSSDRYQAATRNSAVAISCQLSIRRSGSPGGALQPDGDGTVTQIVPERRYLGDAGIGYFPHLPAPPSGMRCRYTGTSLPSSRVITPSRSRKGGQAVILPPSGSSLSCVMSTMFCWFHTTRSA
jgi:hypothetical protein